MHFIRNKIKGKFKVTRLKCLNVFVSCFFRYAMKCLDKKRIKLKSGESMAINERVILSRVSSGVSSPNYF